MNRYIKSLITLLLIVLLIVGVSLMPISSGADIENGDVEGERITAVADR